MKRKTWLTLAFAISLMYSSYAQQKTDLKMTSKFGSENRDLFDILMFENIDYYKIKFNGNELKNKTYKITVKEIWDGNLKSESTVFDSKEMVEMNLDKVNDTSLSLKVISTLTPKNKIKISFVFDRFSNTKEYDAIESDEYSLRNLADESKLPIGYGEKFYFMAVILPYQRANGSKSWCEVGSSGKDIENWGKRFGIKHYLLFEMKFD